MVGDPESIDNYVIDAANDDFVSILTRRDGTTAGVSLIRRHFSESAELHLIAIFPEARGKESDEQSSRVLPQTSQRADAWSYRFTLRDRHSTTKHSPHPFLLLSNGLLPLEEHSNLDWSGPKLILVRRLTSVS